MTMRPKEKSDTQAIGKRVFAEIAARFPSLRMIENTGDPLDIIAVTVPAQSGLTHEVWLSLQNDELHFLVGKFWLEWFPCTDPKEVDSYVDAVTGFLSGRYRVLEHYQGAKCVKAELQVPEETNWRTIGTWSMLRLPFPRKKTFKEIRNI